MLNFHFWSLEYSVMEKKETISFFLHSYHYPKNLNRILIIYFFEMKTKKSVPSKMGFLSSRSIIGKNAQGGESTYGGPGEQDGVIWVLSAPPAIYLPTFLAAWSAYPVGATLLQESEHCCDKIRSHNTPAAKYPHLPHFWRAEILLPAIGPAVLTKQDPRGVLLIT